MIAKPKQTLRVSHIVIIAFAVLAAVGCSRPKVIPDDKLKNILKEIYIANAYNYTHSIITNDSVDFYSPILKKYGYGYDDLEYTVEDFQRRKSANLSEVIKEATKELENEYKYYQERIAINDTIDARLARTFMKTVYTDSLIRVDNIKDTARLRIQIPAEEGRYRITFRARVDTLDKNRNLRTTMAMIDRNGADRDVKSNWMNSRNWIRPDQYVDAQSGDSILQIVFGNYTPALTRPYITVMSLKVVHMLSEEAANKEFLRSIIDVKRIMYDIQDSLPEDSSALRLRCSGPYPLGHSNH